MRGVGNHRRRSRRAGRPAGGRRRGALCHRAEPGGRGRDAGGGAAAVAVAGSAGGPAGTGPGEAGDPRGAMGRHAPPRPGTARRSGRRPGAATPGGNRSLDDFLDCVLAKYDGRYWNRTYLCLPVLERLIEGPEAPLDPVGLAALLAADVVRHELCASSRGKSVSPLDRPDGRTLHTRVRQAARFKSASLGAELATELLAAVAHDPQAGLPDILAALPVAPAPWAADWLEVTVQPVSTVHDEYFFIRALQGHEIGYGVAARSIADAATALRRGASGRGGALRRPGHGHGRARRSRCSGWSRRCATTRSTPSASSRRARARSSRSSTSGSRPAAGRRRRTGSPHRRSTRSPRCGPSSGENHGTLMDAWLDADRLMPGDPAIARVADEHGGARGRAPAVEEHARHGGDADAGRGPRERQHLGRLLPAGVDGPPPVRRRPRAAGPRRPCRP